MEWLIDWLMIHFVGTINEWWWRCGVYKPWGFKSRLYCHGDWKHEVHAWEEESCTWCEVEFEFEEEEAEDSFEKHLEWFLEEAAHPAIPMIAEAEAPPVENVADGTPWGSAPRDPRVAVVTAAVLRAIVGDTVPRGSWKLLPWTWRGMDTGLLRMPPSDRCSTTTGGGDDLSREEEWVFKLSVRVLLQLLLASSLMDRLCSCAGAARGMLHGYKGNIKPVGDGTKEQNYKHN